MAGQDSALTLSKLEVVNAIDERHWKTQKSEHDVLQNESCTFRK